MRSAMGWAVVVAALASGCASTLAQQQTARPVERGHVQFTGGLGFYAPLGAAGSVVSRGLNQAAQAAQAVATGTPYAPSESDLQDLLSAGLALAVFPPSPMMEFSARTGVAPNMDVGLRYSVSALKLDAKYRIWHGGDGEDTPADLRQSRDVAIGLGVSRYFFDNPFTAALEVVRLNDFSRWDFEVPVYASYELGHAIRVYGGVKYIYSRTNLNEDLSNDAFTLGSVTQLDLSIPTLVHSHFVGATIGTMLGYRYAFISLELTPGWTFCNPYVLGQRRNLGGFTLYPAVGLVLSF